MRILRSIFLQLAYDQKKSRLDKEAALNLQEAVCL